MCIRDSSNGNRSSNGDRKCRWTEIGFAIIAVMVRVIVMVRITATRTVLGNGLKVIGVSAPEKM